MSDSAQQDEPTMEEILASIRKIISDDAEPGAKNTDTAPADEPAHETIVLAEPEPLPAEVDDVLELTDDMTEADDDVMEISDEEEAIETVMEEEPIEEPAPLPEPDIETSFTDIDDVDPAEGEEVLMSEHIAASAMSQFGALSDVLTKGYQGSENTLEALVRELLKPMLKSWLDDNLPPIVERMVAKEIARLARTKQK